MRVTIEDLARECLDDIFYYNAQYSARNAIETDIMITQYIQDLEDSPYIGRCIPEIADNRFREIIYKKTQKSGYRIMYYISKNSNTIFVFNIINSKQDFIRILKLHNYFNNYFNI